MGNWKKADRVGELLVDFVDDGTHALELRKEVLLRRSATAHHARHLRRKGQTAGHDKGKRRNEGARGGSAD